MVRKNESSNQWGQESKGQLGQGKKIGSGSGSFREIKTFQGGNALQSVSHHSSVHCLNTIDLAPLEDAARIFQVTVIISPQVSILRRCKWGTGRREGKIKSPLYPWGLFGSPKAVVKPVAWQSGVVVCCSSGFSKHLNRISSVTAWVLLGQLWSGLKFCIKVVFSLSFSLALPQNPNC